MKPPTATPRQLPSPRRGATRRAALTIVVALGLVVATQLHSTAQSLSAPTAAEGENLGSPLATASAQPRAEASPTGIAKWIPLVLAGAALLVWLRKRQAPGIGAAAALPVSLVGKLRVAPHAQLAVVKAGREHLLLGITPTSVSLVAPLSADVVAQWNAPEPPPARDFPGKSTRNWLGGKR